jgi:hypothetical protein
MLAKETQASRRARARGNPGREGASVGDGCWQKMLHAIHSPQIAGGHKAELFSHELFCPFI